MGIDHSNPAFFSLNRGCSKAGSDLTRFEWGVSVELGAGEELAGALDTLGEERVGRGSELAECSVSMPLLSGGQLLLLGEPLRRGQHALVGLRLCDIGEHLVRLINVAARLVFDALEVFGVAYDVRLVHVHALLVVRRHWDGEARGRVDYSLGAGSLMLLLLLLLGFCSIDHD